MLKVLLVRPNSPIFPTPVPLGLGAVAGALRRERGDRVEILDARLLRWSAERVARRVREVRPDVVGITALSFERRAAHEVAAAARHAAPRARVIVGGPYASASRGAVLADANVDAVVVGEGEETAVELCTAFAAGARLAPVRGIVFRDGDERVATGPRPPIADLDRVETAWDLIDPPRYFSRLGRSTQNSIRKHHRGVSVFTSRGCPYGCVYCHNVFGKRYRARSPEAVLAELELLRRRYDVREVEFNDDTFAHDLPRAKAIASGMIERRLGLVGHFPNGIRGDGVDAELLDLLRDAGFFRIAVAIESASPRLQGVIRKHLDLDKVRWTIEEVVRRGMLASGFFMMGFPTETYDDMMTTAEWAASSELHIADFFYLNPFPGTAVARMAGRDFTDLEFKDYRGIAANVSAATDAELHAANKHAFRRFYLSPRRLARLAAILPKNPLVFLNALAVARLFFQDEVIQ